MKQLHTILMMALLTMCHAHAAQKAQQQELFERAQEVTYQERLWDAVSVGSAYDVETAIQHGANVNVSDEDGDLPLLSAAKQTWASGDYGKVITLLLKAGANPAARNSDGQTALEYAREWKCTKALRAFKEFEKIHKKSAEMQEEKQL